jgi:very-short-patch-repair endonuclease
VVRRSALAPKEIVSVRRKRATSIVRTLSDHTIRLSVAEAVTVTDMALHTRLVRLEDLQALCMRRARSFGVASLRRVVGFAEPAAESPMESRLRMLLILGGLPRPQAQVPLHDSQGRFLGRPDLYYASHCLALEYDGSIHRTSLVEDNRRQNRLLSAGVRMLRFTAGDVLGNPDSVLTQVRGYLACRPVSPGGPARAGLRRVGLSAGAGTPWESGA